LKYYELILKGIPIIEFAHSYTTERYDMYFGAKENKFEISYIEKGDFVKTFDTGESLQVPAPCIFLSSQMQACRNHSDAPLHKHFTVGINAEIEVHEIDKEQIIQYYKNMFGDNRTGCVRAILPEITVDYAYVHIIKDFIKKIILINSVNNRTSGLTAISLLMNIFEALTEWSFKQALTQQKSAFSFSDTVYCEKAIAYLTKNIRQKIAIDEIAESLSISKGHLSRIFKAVTGHSLIDYSNLLKMNFVKELINTKNINLNEAGSQIGIYDEKYLCRIFKKYTGMTFMQYRVMNSLEHNMEGSPNIENAGGSYGQGMEQNYLSQKCIKYL